MSLGFFSHQCRLLPYLEQTALYASINFEAGTVPPDNVPAGAESRFPNPAINSTASQTGVAVFLCPSDGGPFAEVGNSYRANVGVGPDVATTAEHPDSGNGLFPETGTTRPAGVPDGLSHTAAFSERTRGSGNPTAPSPSRDFWLALGFVRTADDLIVACQILARPTNKSVYADGGSSWFWAGREQTTYNHAQEPNGVVPDCMTQSFIPNLGMSTARSAHPGGVHVLMGDGSVRWASDSISREVWRGLGTRNGGELVD